VTAGLERGLSGAGLRTKLLWIAAFYFASGFPFGVVNNLVPIYFRDSGAELGDIARVIGYAGYAWTLKFLWAPLVDRFGTRKGWIIATQALLGVTVALLSLVDPRAAGILLVALLLAIAALSATQDITLDAYAIEILREREMGPANGVRVTAYRGSLLFAGGLLVALAAVTGWRWVFFVGAAVMLGIALLSVLAPATPRGSARHEPVWRPLVAFLGRRHLWAIILFALTFKLGDSAMQVMAETFLVDAGLTLPQIGLLGTLAIGAVVGGALLGGVLIARWGTYRALWTLGAVQALSNLGYVLAASLAPSVWLIGGAKVFEYFTAGLGTAAFLTFLMSICEKRYAATQYALLSALYGFGRQTAISVSGDLTEGLGYATYFFLTFLLALPAFALLPWIRRVERQDVEAITD
jgi:MFS transporter, PAT family, beta-lactamase induction signal transducer AmpG